MFNSSTKGPFYTFFWQNQSDRTVSLYALCSIECLSSLHKECKTLDLQILVPRKCQPKITPERGPNVCRLRTQKCVAFLPFLRASGENIPVTKVSSSKSRNTGLVEGFRSHCDTVPPILEFYTKQPPVFVSQILFLVFFVSPGLWASTIRTWGVLLSPKTGKKGWLTEGEDSWIGGSLVSRMSLWPHWGVLFCYKISPTS